MMMRVPRRDPEMLQQSGQRLHLPRSPTGPAAGSAAPSPWQGRPRRHPLAARHSSTPGTAVSSSRRQSPCAAGSGWLRMCAAPARPAPQPRQCRRARPAPAVFSAVFRPASPKLSPIERTCSCTSPPYSRKCPPKMVRVVHDALGMRRHPAHRFQVLFDHRYLRRRAVLDRDERVENLGHVREAALISSAISAASSSSKASSASVRSMA